MMEEPFGNGLDFQHLAWVLHGDADTFLNETGHTALENAIRKKPALGGEKEGWEKCGKEQAGDETEDDWQIFSTE